MKHKNQITGIGIMESRPDHNLTGLDRPIHRTFNPEHASGHGELRRNEVHINNSCRDPMRNLLVRPIIYA